MACGLDQLPRRQSSVSTAAAPLKRPDRPGAARRGQRAKARQGPATRSGPTATSSASSRQSPEYEGADEKSGKGHSLWTSCMRTSTLAVINKPAKHGGASGGRANWSGDAGQMRCGTDSRSCLSGLNGGLPRGASCIGWTANQRRAFILVAKGGGRRNKDPRPLLFENLQESSRSTWPITAGILDRRQRFTSESRNLAHHKIDRVKG